MKAYVIAGPDDTAGFALAGVTPLSPEELQKIDAAESVLVFSAEAARRQEDLLSRWRRTGSGPLFAVLPEP
jgi:hypothetical protein